MRRFLLSILAIFAFATMNAQNCSELFISAYTEGYGNNRALELYNPTANAIDLSAYSVGRFSNGEGQFRGVQLPADMIEPYGNYVVVVDKRDSLGTGFETPVWNGYQLYDTCFDAVSGMPLLDSAGNIFNCVQYDADGLHLYGTVYNDFLDLKGRADVFLCPVYATNNAMYFNGNDAVALIKGTTPSGDGSNVIDVIGVIGEDPGDAWTNAGGLWLTKDKTLVRKPTVEEGTGPLISNLGNTWPSEQWEIYPKNTFTVLDGQHDCACDPNFTNTQPINIVDFSVYPNPTSGSFVVEAEERINRVEVYNMVGQIVYNNASFNAEKANINLNSTNKGIHIVKIYFDNESVAIQKLLVD
ncbi:MAG: T9SS type A sorting domain-containing protein [Saprospiraceae bacterium]